MLPIAYSQAVTQVQNGDMIAVERVGDISLVGRGKFSHIATYAARPDDLGGYSDSCAESIEGIGGRITSLRMIVKGNPGRTWVFRPLCPKHIRDRAATYAYNWCIENHHYDYKGILKVLLLHTFLPLRVAKFFGHAPNPTEEQLEPWDADKFCSELHVYSYLKSLEYFQHKDDWRPIFGMNPQYVEPSDLTRSGSYRLRFECPLILDEAIEVGEAGKCAM